MSVAAEKETSPGRAWTDASQEPEQDDVKLGIEMDLRGWAA